MDAHDGTVSRLARRIAAVLAVRRALAVLAAGCFAWGVAVVALRAAGVGRVHLLWGLAGVAAPGAAAVWAALRRRPSRSAVRALLDDRGGCGGLLMAAEDVALGAWAGRIAAVRCPGLSWRPGRRAALLAVSAAFVAVGFLVPARFVSAGGGRALDIGREADRLAAQIETLRAEEIVKPEKARDLTAQLRQLRAEAAGEDPVKTWEALDHVEREVSAAAREAAEAALGRTERLAKAETLARGMSQDAGRLKDAQLAEAMNQLAEMTRAAAQECQAAGGKAGEAGGDLSKAAAELSKSAGQLSKSAGQPGGEPMSPEDLARLAEALKECKGGLVEQLESLCRAGLVSEELLDRAAQLGRCDPAGLLDHLGECAGEGSVAELVEQWCSGNRPGRGGVNRGRGDAAMTWTDGTDEQGAAFKEKVLLPSRVADLKESRLVGVSTGAPQPGKGGEASEPGALSGAAAGGGSAHRQAILPRHRKTVQQYFQRK